MIAGSQQSQPLQKTCLNCGGLLRPVPAEVCVVTRYTDETLLLYRHECPAPFRPGSEDKVRTLAARYHAGLPFWNESDLGMEEDD